MTSGRCKNTFWGILLILILGMLPSSASANGSTASDVSVEVQSSILVSISDAAIDATMDEVSVASSVLNVMSNNATGYNTYISTASLSTDLKHTTTEDIIPTIAGSTSKASFPLNHWGFSLDDSTYQGMPDSDNAMEIASASLDAAGETSTDIYFATKVGANMTSGTYSNTMVVTVVPNYVPLSLAESYHYAGKTRVTTDDGRKYFTMQDMTPEICVTADKEHSSLQVIDERDNKVYWITKLKDGNCWMTQNLDYDLSVAANRALIPATSDVAKNRTVTPVSWGTGYDSIYYKEGGDDYYTNGTTRTSGYSSLPSNDINRHYAAGDYYSWKAATAGQGTTSITDADVTESICPKGWRLPTSNSDSANYSFGNLVKQYGYSGSNQSSGITDSALLASPLFFARGGNVGTSSLANQGSLGRYWSSKAYSNNRKAYRLNFGSSSVDPSSNDYRFYGFSVRCVAHGNAISLAYNANGGTNAPSASVAESNSTSATITISSTIPTRERYNFLGWATSSTATTPDYVYSNDSFTPSTITVTGNQTLYAVWEEAILYMQDVTSWMDDLELEQQAQAIDTRDNKLYWVAKLKDGNIWMTQNLDYDIKATGNIISNNDGTTNTWSPNTATSTSIYNNTSYTGTYSYDPGNYYMPNGTGSNTSIASLTDSSIIGNTNAHYHLGNYYQWNAATAGAGGTITNTDATSSICPKGWRLPTNNSYTENYSFGKLTNAYGITNSANGSLETALVASPLFFARGGFVYSGSLGGQGSYGDYWSSRAYSDTYNAYNLGFYSSNVGPSYSNYRNYGFSVRCVAIGPTLNDISTMQEMTPAIVAATPENTSKQLIDTRDDKLYWVTKLADDNIWMTQNLDYNIVAGDNIISNNDGTTSIWNTSSTYAPQATTTTIYNDKSMTGTYSYDPGSNYIPNGTGTSTAITCTSTSNGGENCHYHLGNYYQYNAATAGTGGTIINADATSSICPKGWRLPTSNSATANYSFGNLVKQYGYSGSTQSSGVTDSTLLASPLFFARGGLVYPGSLYYQGSGGYYWSSRADLGTTYAYDLYFRSSYVDPSDNYDRYYGYSVRCVAL